MGYQQRRKNKNPSYLFVLILKINTQFIAGDVYTDERVMLRNIFIYIIICM